MSDNPAPRRVGASPVKWGEILSALSTESANADRWMKLLTEELAAGELGDKSRAVLQSAIASHERRAEVFAAAWRFIWVLRHDDRLRDRLRAVLAAERVGEVEADQLRYD
ncbi:MULTISPECIES: hypothetical protein [unclassified Bradyrhizobium]|uniref:hypothetical protein n=1 Tax=unclassified Bradyrhizobium TaxID=2631580 RepID=UPI0029168C03|nr:MULTISPECIES: hypothetical protein [unclassified Bradyrhizobium]